MQPAKENEKLSSLLYKGSNKQVLLPSSRPITIREQNGGDDDILSRIGESEGSNVIIFLANIIQKDEVLGRKPTVEDIKSWGVKDKYYALLQSRIFSLGRELKWKHTCSDPNCARNKPKSPGPKGSFAVVEDLSLFGDGTENIFRDDYQRITYGVTPYPMKDKMVIEIKLSSGKYTRYHILDSSGENLRLQASENERTENFKFIIRNLEVKIDQEWVSVKDFQVFSPRDMMELRKSLDENDKEFVPLTTVTCPTCGNLDYVNILTLPDFFYPLEM